MARLPHRVDLDALIAQANERYQRLTPQEKASMSASQALGYVAAETCMAVYEDGYAVESAQSTLDSLLAIIDGDASHYLTRPDVVHRVMQLTQIDKASLRARIQKMRDQLSTQ